jgi:hypothetical protein
MHCLYCSPLRQGGLGQSTLWLTLQEVSHAKAHMGREDQGDDWA